MLSVVCLRSDRLFLPFEGIRGMTFAKQMRLPLYVAARDQPLQQRRHSRLHPKPVAVSPINQYRSDPNTHNGPVGFWNDDTPLDRGYPSHLVWLSRLMFVFEVLVHQKGNDSAWQDIKQLADDYFGGFRPKRRLLFGAETIH
jgi:hypothetical protein